MKRGGSNKLTNFKGVQVRGTGYCLVPDESVDDIYVITTAGDRLDLLAKEYYGDMHYWYYIAKVNNINTITVDAGLKLRLPQIIPGIK